MHKMPSPFVKHLGSEGTFHEFYVHYYQDKTKTLNKGASKWTDLSNKEYGITYYKRVFGLLHYIDCTAITAEKKNRRTCVSVLIFFV